MDTSETQGKTYKMTDIRQSKEYANYLASQGWIIERIANTSYFIKKLPIIGSVLKVQRPNRINFETIKKIEKKYRVFQTIIEPDLYCPNSITKFFDHSLLLQKGFKLSKSPYLPTKTMQLDLDQTKDQIYRNFSKGCRYSIKRGEGIKIVEYSTPDQLQKFHEAWKKSVNFNRYVPSLESLLKLKKSFPQSKSLFLASHNKVGSIIGGAIFTTSSHEISNYITYREAASSAYYWQGFTNSEGRTSLSQYSLLYQGILWGKKNGSKVFDLEGIYDERFPQKSWLGFTHFKKQFGGKEILYPGCYTRFRFPI